MRYEFLREVKVSVLVFWVVTTCGFVDPYQHFKGTFCHFNHEEGSSVFLLNVICLQVYKVFPWR
jgi:hypothetical protein